MDPWYGLGGADMLDVAHMAVHAVPMTSREAIRWTFDAVTEIPARVMGLEGYGLAGRRLRRHGGVAGRRSDRGGAAARERLRGGATRPRHRAPPPRVMSLDLPGPAGEARSRRLRAPGADDQRLRGTSATSSKAAAGAPQTMVSASNFTSTHSRWLSFANLYWQRTAPSAPTATPQSRAARGEARNLTF